MAGDWVVAFSKLDLPGKWSARNTIHSRKEFFAGLVEIDGLLRSLHLLPPCVSRQELTREENSLQMIKSREALEAKREHRITVKASGLINTMESIIIYRRANYFESSCALSFVSGRGLRELVGTDDFLPATHGPYQSQVEHDASKESKRVLNLLLPLQCDYEHFMEGVNILRTRNSFLSGVKCTHTLICDELKRWYPAQSSQQGELSCIVCVVLCGDVSK